MNGSRTVKLADFGMTRATFESDYYKFQRRGKENFRSAPLVNGEGGRAPTESYVDSFQRQYCNKFFWSERGKQKRDKGWVL